MSFEYEFIFTKVYDENVFYNAPVTHSTEFENLIKTTLETMINILNMYGGVKTFSSFINFEDKSYKITVNNE